MKRFHFFKRKTSGKIARERLKQLLLHDRLSLSTDLSEKIQKDLSRTISRYLEINEHKISVEFEKNPDTKEVFIHAVIPVITARQRR